MPSGLRVNEHLTIPDHELRWSFGPSGGPGGQHANTANTRADVMFDISDSQALNDIQRARLGAIYGAHIRVSADDSRSQARNRDIAATRLADRIERALRPARRRRPTTPSRGAIERRLRAKRQRSQRKAGRRYRPDGD
jgi:ribosome-associated protein